MFSRESCLREENTISRRPFIHQGMLCRSDSVMSFIGTSRGGQGIGDDKSIGRLMVRLHSQALASRVFVSRVLTYMKNPNQHQNSGARVNIWHIHPRIWGKKWGAGDVLGVACDLDTRTIKFSER